ncbi:hypothetical protein FB45DRAFT_1066665 [Roridomyces roridus]|uniref:F-box domain-containing protein n=1 Tax=Roridomyces roridus TaxID=1738132 RepID=A0AAD7B496_9AGAR|nr:hypothetical protein FB45DRAFT_1066665 [Roridomyces roridus]
MHPSGQRRPRKQKSSARARNLPSQRSIGGQPGATSAQELEARIEDISADIERQPEKGVLQGLERDKSLLQRQLNAIRDPIQRLPLEISSEIFVQCLPEYPTLSDVCSVRPRGTMPKFPTMPTLLLNICNAWTDIAASNPKLWSRMNIEFPAHRVGLEVMVEKWFQRARSHLLDVSLTGALDATVAALIWRYSSQLGRLTLSLEPLGPGDHSHVESVVFWELLGTQPEPVPLLQFLEINGRRKFEYSPRPILRFLSLASNITELILCVALAEEKHEIHVVVLPNLRRLQGGGHGGSLRILDYICAPQLLSLTVVFPRTNGDIVPFLQHSSSALQELVIEGAGKLALDEILTLVPSLIRFEIQWPHIKDVGQLFNILAQPPPSDVVPNLRILKLDLINSDPTVDQWTSESWDTFIRVARRTHIESIHMSDRYAFLLYSLPHDAWESLRELAEDGKDIWIENIDAEINILFCPWWWDGEFREGLLNY